MDNAKRTKRTRLSRSERGEMLAAFRRSGMTQEAFARSRGLNVATLRNWIHAGKAMKPAGADGFIEVTVASPGPAVATLRFADGATIEFPVAELERVALRLARELAAR